MIDKKGWEKKKLSEVGQVVTGNTPKTSDNSNYSSNDFCFFKPSDLRGNNISLLSESENNISDSAFRNSRNLPIGSVLVTCIGTIGNVGVTTVVSTSNQQINAIIPNNETDSRFLAYSIYSIKSYLNHIANAPVVPIINKTQFSSVEIYIPPLPIQQQIVSELDTLSDIISKKKQQLADLDTLAQATFFDMFGDPVSNEKGWKMKLIGEISSLKSGQFVKASDINSQYFKGLYPCFGGNGLRGYTKSFTHNGEFVLIGRQGALCGNVKIVKDVFHATEHAVVCTPLDSYEALWFYYILKILNLNKYATGAAQPGLAVGKLEKIEIPFSPILLQNKFARQIELIEVQKELINKSIDEVQHLFDYTMDRYFN